MLKERLLEMHHPSEEESLLDHGYNEEKGLENLDGGSRRNTGHRSFTVDARKGTAVSKAPDISESTVEERRAYIKAKYPCIADCDMCGLCKVFRGVDAEHAYNEYIIGKRSYHDVAADYRHR